MLIRDARDTVWDLIVLYVDNDRFRFMMDYDGLEMLEKMSRAAAAIAAWYFILVEPIHGRQWLSANSWISTTNNGAKNYCTLA